ncbi:MAG: hypothetical protein ACF8XB_05600 [Planctomycetota bacterium JB042]
MRLSIVVVGLLGVGLGVLLGFLSWAVPSDEGVAALEGKSAEPERVEDVVATPEVVEESREAVGRSGAVRSGDPRFSEELRRHFADGYVDGWRAVRPEPPEPEQVEVGEAEFRREVLALPERLGREDAEARSKEEALERALAVGDGLTILEAAAEGRYHPNPEDEGLELVDRCLDRRFESGAVSGEAWDASTLRDGLTIVFGPGRHTLSTRDLRRKAPTPFPADVTIQGAGMDATLVAIDEEISVRSDVERLRFRDLTVDTANDYAFHLRRDGALLDFERVRVVRFDMGAGGSLAFSVHSGMMLRARDCQILGGYGRSPGSGSLFRGAALLARFERCRFDLIDLELDQVKGGEVLFLHCTFDRLRVDPTRWASPRIRFVGCRVGERIAAPPGPPMDVGTLVPGG